MNLSFNELASSDSPFIRMLADVVSFADMSNIRKLNTIYPAAVAAKGCVSFDDIPVGKFPVIFNKLEEAEFKHNCESSHNEGSFYWYLFYSGHFVSAMARLIRLADTKNRKLIGEAYPQMVAAFDMPDWSVAPKGFKPEYNSEPLL